MLKKYAKLLVHYSIKTKPGEKTLIRATPLATPLIQALYEELLKAGAIVETALTFENQSKIFHQNASDTQLNAEPTFFKYAIENFDAMITIDAPYDSRELADIPSETKLKRAKAMAPVRKTYMDRAAEGKLKWVLCEYPTETAAKEAGMSLKNYEKFIYNGCYLHKDNPIKEWQTLSANQQSYVDHLNTTDTIRFIGPDNSTDITFSTKGRRWINSDGIHNMPSGEVFTSPVEDSANGIVFFNYPTLYNGKDVQNVTLTVENGHIKTWKAEIGQDALDEAFAIEGSRYFGEIAIGTNSEIQTPTRNILFDEKIGGTIHMAVGASYPETGGKNESSLHWDMITDMKSGGKILANNKEIYKNGHFTLPK